MERQDLYETLQKLYGQMNPIVDEIVQEYTDPCYLFNISFDLVNHKRPKWEAPLPGDNVNVRFEVPVRITPENMTTPEGTKVITFDCSFEFVKTEGNYQFTLVVPRRRKNPRRLSFSISRLAEGSKWSDKSYSEIPLLHESKVDNHHTPQLTRDNHRNIIMAGNLEMVIRREMVIYGLEDRSMGYLLERPDITYLTMFERALGL
jgi:hypothetical protein